MSELKPLLLDKNQARQLFAGMPEDTFMKLARDHGIFIGNSYYWRPGDLEEIAQSLNYGKKQS
ncbi:hypothetical protein BACT_1102 [Bifidobacterium actinocoloniiforme DSM 22766]|uniref:Uncharacterized protein n=1 Tax=Bifidobacterium actinocoloniiforme DSM 22766 TaxID=1437605 RepID=A0A086Z1K0_9BIFI|nr:hypothetical protein [Bifidobacterium actinocoloniiforme]AKV55534.1 hypothetical protein AB656_04120 [Bifidobacterium actinocoloniiforme DSM 22766]KFI40400.1 hypothetical protein BACT_1102 [Bifidobacterium actinocoloniiforme DSM 22766]